MPENGILMLRQLFMWPVTIASFSPEFLKQYGAEMWPSNAKLVVWSEIAKTRLP